MEWEYLQTCEWVLLLGAILTLFWIFRFHLRFSPPSQPLARSGKTLAPPSSERCLLPCLTFLRTIRLKLGNADQEGDTGSSL